LLVIDNLETPLADPGLNNFIANLPDQSKAVLATREAHRYPASVHLAGLSKDETRQLLSRELPNFVLGEDRIEMIYWATDGLPLAIKIVAGMLAEGVPWDYVQDVLKGAGCDRGMFWDLLMGGRWKSVTSQARSVLMAASVFPAPASPDALIAASGVQVPDFYNRALPQLLRGDLLTLATEPLVNPRYAIGHVIVQTFAANRLRASSSEAEVWDRVQSHYLALCRRHAKDFRVGYPVLKQDLPNIIAVLRSCYERHQYRILLDFLEEISYFLYDTGHWPERLEWSQKGYQAAMELGDFHRAGKCTYWEGWYRWRVREWEAAREAAKRADECFHKAHPEMDKEEREPRVSQLLGMIAFGQQQFEEAENWYKQALAGFERQRASVAPEFQEDKDFWRVTVLTNLGDLAVFRGDQARRLEESRLATERYTEACDWYIKVRSEAEQRCGHANQLRTYDRWAARLARTLGNLGDVNSRLSKLDSAAECYQQGRNLATQMDLPNTRGACAVGLGLLCWRRNERGWEDLLKEGLEVFDRLGSRSPTEQENLSRAREIIEKGLPPPQGSHGGF